jgi:glycosyltransferase involved in cell wall biosynthesis
VTETASITVVVPCYNAADWISTSLRSAVTQDWPALEVMVVDDGSKDGSVELVTSRFPEVKVLQQRNGGAAAARNAGIRAARGDWIAFLDADDFWLPGKLRAQMDLLSTQPQAQISCTAWEFWHSADADPTPELLSRLQAETTSPSQGGPACDWIYPELLLGCCVWTSTVVARTELLRQLGGFDVGLKIGEDYDLWLRASRLTPIARVTRPLALYRQHPASLTKQTPEVNYEADVVGRAIARWGYASPDGRRARPADVSRSLARTWQNFGAAHLEAGHARQALRAGLKSIRAHWQTSSGWKLTAKALYRSVQALVQPRKT